MRQSINISVILMLLWFAAFDTFALPMVEARSLPPAIPAAPVINYHTPNVYIVNRSINQLIPVNNGGAVPATIYGQTSVLAGNGHFGTNDGLGSAADITSPWGLTTDADGNIYLLNLNSRLRLITPSGQVSTIAQDGIPGNGGDPAKKFNNPKGIIRDAAGNLYIANTGWHNILKIVPDGTITVFSGGTPKGHAVNGPGATASIINPSSIAMDAAGNLYVTDANNLIRQISSNGYVSTFAGSGAAATADGKYNLASFNVPAGLVFDAVGNLYVTEQKGYVIRKITPLGDAIVFAGSGQYVHADGTGAAAGFINPTGITIDRSGNLYVADLNGTIRKITPDRVVTTVAGGGSVGNNNAVGKDAYFNMPTCITMGPDGNLYVSDANGDYLKKVIATGYTIDKDLPPGMVFDSKTGIIAGKPISLWPETIYTITAYNAGGSSSTTVNIKVTNDVLPPPVTNPPVIKYTTPNVYHVNIAIPLLKPANTGGAVPANAYAQASTFAGNGVKGNVTGPAANAEFNGAYNLVTDAAGNVYAADALNNQIKKITPDGTVSVFAGTGAQGNNDNDVGTLASFNNPISVAIDAIGNLYVNDALNTRIRKISPTGKVTTLATGVSAFGGIAVAGNGDVYVSTSSNTIEKITQAGVGTVFAGTGNRGAYSGPRLSSTFNSPSGLAFDASGNLWVADASNSLIREIKTDGNVITFTDVNGTHGGFSAPNGLVFDALGNLYVGDTGNNKIKKISPDGTVTIIAGNAAGYVNGIGQEASFNYVSGVAIDAEGHAFIGDFGNNVIRKVNLTGYIIDKPLPAGLVFDGATGIISGTPTEKLAPTDYTVTAYNLGGSSSFTFKIEIVAAPIITVSDVIGNISSCEGTVSNDIQEFTVSGKYLSGDIILDTENDGFEVSLVHDGGYTNRLVLPQGNGTVGPVNIYVHMMSVDAGTYTDNVKLSSDGITNDVLVPVKGVVNPLVIPTVNIAADLDPSCEGSTVKFTAAISNAGANPSFQWYINGQIADNGNVNPFSTSNLNNGDEVTCTVTNTTDCSGGPVPSQPLIINRTPKVAPVVTVVPKTHYPVCPNGPVTFTATPVAADNTYQWQVNHQNVGNASNSPDFTSATLKENDELTCIVTVTQSCTIPGTSTPFKYHNSQLPTVSFNGDLTIKSGQSHTLSPVVNGDIATYSWSPVEGLSNPNIKNPEVKLSNTTVYTLLVTTADGCPGFASVTVNVVKDIFVPNAFTPNGDGHNDTWEIAELKDYPGCVISVFNRQGEKLFYSVGYAKAWNGYYNNSMLPNGTYYYLIDPKNGFPTKSGYVTILR